MAPIVMWIVVALAAAVVVILVASVAGGRSGGMRQFLADLRAGLRRDRGPGEGGGGFLADARRDLADADEVETSSVEEIFTIGEPQQTAYLGTRDIADTLNRAAGRARSAGRR